MNIPQCGIKLHSGNFSAIGKILQEQLSDGKCLRLQVKEWREKRSLSQNALSHMWYAEISEYLINSGRTDATPEWVKRNLKKTYLGCEVGDLHRFHHRRENHDLGASPHRRPRHRGNAYLPGEG